MNIAEAPQWLIDLCGKPREKEHLETQIELDTDAATKRATAYLKENAPYAIDGEGGNQTTYMVAARVKDFGISEAFALDLMLEHFNEDKAIPPWQPDDLERIVGNAYRYGTAPVGKFDASLEFEPYEMPVIPKTRIEDNWPSPDLIQRIAPEDIPVRQWILDSILARSYLTGLVAPSGAGKTQWLAQLLLSITTGRNDLAHATVRESCPVWCWNQEDDINELNRRIASSKVHFNIEWDHLTHDIYLNSGVDRALLLVERNEHGNLRPSKNVDRIIGHIQRLGIGVLIIDPLVEFHEADENDNVEMRIVAATLRRIAARANCAVMVGHHTRKPVGARSDGFSGDADSARGASSLQGVTRIMLTLYAMSSKDAKDHSVKESDRHRYIRLDGAKSNLSLAGAGAKPMWLERVEAQLGFEGETVGALAPVELAKARVEKVAESEPGARPASIWGAIAAKMEGAHAARWTDIRALVAAEIGISEKTLDRRRSEAGPGPHTLTDGRKLRFTGKAERGHVQYVNLEYISDIMD